MALADSVPGVSGGTIAFLLGFYDRFLSSLDNLIHGSGQGRRPALKFLIQLGLGWVIGMGLAILALSRVFESHIYAISSVFIGFILFAIPLVLHEEKMTLRGRWKWSPFVLAGIVFVVVVSSIHPVSGGAVSGVGSLVYVFLGGLVAISAMVLPGISGSTLLLIMGLYLPVITAVRAVMGFDFSALPTVIAFALGVCAGVALIIRLLLLFDGALPCADDFPDCWFDAWITLFCGLGTHYAGAAPRGDGVGHFPPSVFPAGRCGDPGTAGYENLADSQRDSKDGRIKHCKEQAPIRHCRMGAVFPRNMCGINAFGAEDGVGDPDGNRRGSLLLPRRTTPAGRRCWGEPSGH